MATLTVDVTDPLARFVEEEVDTGLYSSADEVVREALRLLLRERQLQRSKNEIFRREVLRGVEAADTGRFATRTLEEIAASVLQEEEGRFDRR